MLTLYQFPISHYCEKIRWALDYKKLKYTTKNLLPGFHRFTTKKLVSNSMLPILVHDNKVVQNSSDIIDYLDETFPQLPLTPQQEKLKQEALDWEKYVDKEIGLHVRRFCYSYLLDYPSIVIPFFTHNGPWYGKPLMKMFYPKLKKTMISTLNINAENRARSKLRIERAIDKIHTHRQGDRYLVGNTFSRADIAAAALLAPLCQPEKYGLDWPLQQPEPLEIMIRELGDKINWVSDLYSQHR